MTADLYRYKATLVSWRDADTCVVHLDMGLRIWAHDVALRIAGIQAPDRQPAKQAATDWVNDLWPPGTQLIVQTIRNDRDDEITTFDRWMAHIWDTAGLSVADVLIDSAMAVPWDGKGQRPDT
jgi:endonuclease YncB( thermonuclease family)